SADGTARVLAVGGNPCLWLPPLETGRKDLVLWAQLLSGRQIASTEQTVPVKPESLRRLWRSLKPGYRHAFEPSDRSSWHQRAAEECEQAQHWFGAAFHWERARTLNQDQPSLRARWEHAESE
ncbi:MAG: hypothetical protein DME25_22090, partial [Verrucomicrobia bacterium]